MDAFPNPTEQVTTPRRLRGDRPPTRLPFLLLLLLGVIVLWYLPVLLERIQYSRTKGEVQALRESLPELNLKGLSKTFPLIYRKVRPSVVHIDTRREFVSRRNDFGLGVFGDR